MLSTQWWCVAWVSSSRNNKMKGMTHTRRSMHACVCAVCVPLAHQLPRITNLLQVQQEYFAVMPLVWYSLSERDKMVVNVGATRLLPSLLFAWSFFFFLDRCWRFQPTLEERNAMCVCVCVFVSLKRQKRAWIQQQNTLNNIGAFFYYIRTWAAHICSHSLAAAVWVPQEAICDDIAFVAISACLPVCAFSLSLSLLLATVHQAAVRTFSRVFVTARAFAYWPEKIRYKIRFLYKNNLIFPLLLHIAAFDLQPLVSLHVIIQRGLIC